MKTALLRPIAIVVMLVVLVSTYFLKLVGIEHPKMEAFTAAGVAAILIT